jgi:hypothetical protein
MTLNRLILNRVRANPRVSHDSITFEFGQRAAEAIHSLYMADLIGISDDGQLYPRY